MQRLIVRLIDSQNPEALQAALRSAGAGCYATDLVMRGEVQNAFCAVRPPGHHATRDESMGFCFVIVLMTAGFVLTGYQLAGLYLGDPS